MGIERDQYSKARLLSRLTVSRNLDLWSRHSQPSTRKEAANQRPLGAEVKMSTLRFLLTAVLFGASQALAEMAPAPTEGPGPLARHFPCDAFVKNADGSWVP